MVLSVCETVASALIVGHAAPRGNRPNGEGRREEDAGICKCENGQVNRMWAQGVIRASS